MWSYGGWGIRVERWLPNGNWMVQYAGSSGWSHDYKWKLKMTRIDRQDFPLLLDYGAERAWNQAGYNNCQLTYADRLGDFYSSTSTYLGNTSITTFPGFWHGADMIPLGGAANQLCIDGAVRGIRASDSRRYLVNTATNNWHVYFTDTSRSQPVP